MDYARISEVLHELRQEREQHSTVIGALQSETNLGARKLLDNYMQRRDTIDAAVIAMDNLAGGKRRGRRPGWIEEIRQKHGA